MENASSSEIENKETIKNAEDIIIGVEGAETMGSVPTPAKVSRMDEFVKTATAAKMSGLFHETTGKIKRKIGVLRDDKELQKEGLNQEILGKVHTLVGSVRAFRKDTIKKITVKRQETKDICIKHGSRLIDVATDFVEDLKKTLLK